MQGFPDNRHLYSGIHGSGILYNPTPGFSLEGRSLQGGKQVGNASIGVIVQCSIVSNSAKQ
jgi:hypothetical protein